MTTSISSVRALALISTIRDLKNSKLGQGILSPAPRTPSVEIEDIEYEPETLREHPNGSFECEVRVYFTEDHGGGDTVSGELIAFVGGHFHGDAAIIGEVSRTA